MRKIIPILIFFFLIFSFKIALAEIAIDVNFIGNKRISSSTILEYSKFQKNKDYSSDELDELKKRIFSTGFFEKVNINLSNKILIIEVIENPLVAFLNIQGEEGSETTEKLYDLIKLKYNSIYSEYQLVSDLNEIKDFYIKKGFSEIEVIPKITKIENNKVNILISLNKNDQLKINKIFFIGDKKFNSNDLHDVILSSEHGWWKFFSSTTFASNERVLYDGYLLKEFYLNNGYFDAQITSNEIKKISKDQADLIYSINSGKLYNFGEFKFTEGKNLVNPETLNYIYLLQNQYLQKKYSQKNIKTYVAKLSKYFETKKIEFLDVNIKTIKNNNLIDIFLELTPSKPRYVKNIEVKGNSITEESVIRRNLTFSEGDAFSEYKKKKSEDSLNAINIFKNIKLSEENIESDQVNIKIDVSEKPTGSITAGAGYGNNGGSIGFGISENNFLGKGLSLNSNLNIGTQKIEGFVGIIVPDFAYSDRALYSNLFSTKTSYSNTLYESKKTGINLSTRYQLYDNIFFKPGFGLDYDSISVLSGASSYLESQKGNYITEKLTYSVENDTRDSKVKSRDGSLLIFSQDIATVFSDLPYLKSSFTGSNFYPIFDKQTFNIQYGYSNITSLNNKYVKLSDRLFLPSQFTKGFETRGFGPKDSSLNDFIGGNNSIYATSSVTFANPFQESWKLDTMLFLSAFNLWGKDSSSSIENNKIRSSIGIGVDWRTVIGPVNFSLAKPISKDQSDKTKTFSFEIGTIF